MHAHFRKQLFTISTTIITLLLPHFHTLHLHNPLLFPGGRPLLSRLPEVALSRRTCINPGLSRLSVCKPSVCTTDGDVQNEVELLVERRDIAAGLAPWILQAGSVAIRERELAVGPEGLVEVRVHDLEETGVDVGEDVLVAPLYEVSTFEVEERYMSTHLKAKGMIASCVSGVKSDTLNVVTPPTIIGRVGSEVQSAADNVVASLSVRVVVAAAFHDVNLTRLWPLAIFVVDRQHPDGWPKPVSSG
jgi:hypothetical protein